MACSWSYQNGIWLERAGNVSQVFDDGIAHYSPYLGLVVTFLRSRHVGHAALDGPPGARY